MLKVQSRAADLLNRLKKSGYKIPYIKKTVLPDWWDAALVQDDAAFLETVGYIANGLGVHAESLLDPEREIEVAGTPCARFKTPKALPPEELQQSVGVALSLATAAAEACPIPVGDLPRSSQEMRAALLASHECVNLENLLKFCWELGIVVLPITKFPAPKPDGMALRVGNRPVIVLSKSASHPAWTLFDLAHEIGHLILGHVQGDSMVVDGKIDGTDRDAEEAAANNFAVQLLIGEAAIPFDTEYRLVAEALASKAKVLGREHCVDPGVIVLNYARTMEDAGLSCWPLANGALKLIPCDSTPTEVLREHLLARLDLNELGRETRNWFLRATESR